MCPKETWPGGLAVFFFSSNVVGRATAPVGTALNVRVPGMEDGCVGIFQGEKKGLVRTSAEVFLPHFGGIFGGLGHTKSKTLTWIHWHSCETLGWGLEDGFRDVPCRGDIISTAVWSRISFGSHWKHKEVVKVRWGCDIIEWFFSFIWFWWLWPVKWWADCAHLGGSRQGYQKLHCH